MRPPPVILWPLWNVPKYASGTKHWISICSIYSELPLIWTPEMRPPLYSSHFKMSQSMIPSANSPLKNEATPLIRTLWLVPRVAGLEGVQCTNQDTLTGPKGGRIRGNPLYTVLCLCPSWRIKLREEHDGPYVMVTLVDSILFGVAPEPPKVPDTETALQQTPTNQVRLVQLILLVTV